jgi:hypothetical protein
MGPGHAGASARRVNGRGAVPDPPDPIRRTRSPSPSAAPSPQAISFHDRADSRRQDDRRPVSLSDADDGYQKHLRPASASSRT